MPPVHDHKDQEHPHRPEWWNGISLGNALTIALVVISFAVSWGALSESQAGQDREIASVDKRVTEVDQRAVGSVESVRADLRRIEQKLDQLILQSRRE